MKLLQFGLKHRSGSFYRALRATAILCAFLAPSTHATPAGQVDFQDLSKEYGEPKVEINLNAGLLKMVSGFSKSNDPEVSQLLNKLEGVTVKVYTLQGKRDAAVSGLESLAKKLKQEAWQAIVSVNEENEKVRILSRSSDGKMDGLVIMVVEGLNNPDQAGEAVFINIMGEIDPANIGKVTSSLNFDLGDHAKIQNTSKENAHSEPTPQKTEN